MAKKFAIIWKTGFKKVPRSIVRFKATNIEKAIQSFKKKYPKRKILDVHQE